MDDRERMFRTVKSKSTTIPYDNDEILIGDVIPNNSVSNQELVRKKPNNSDNKKYNSVNKKNNIPQSSKNFTPKTNLVPNSKIIINNNATKKNKMNNLIEYEGDNPEPDLGSEDSGSNDSEDEIDDFLSHHKNIRVTKAFLNNIEKNDWWGNLAYLSEQATVIIGGLHLGTEKNIIPFSGVYSGDGELRKLVEEHKKHYKVLRLDFDKNIMISPDLSQLATIDIRTIQIGNSEYTSPHFSLFIFDAKNRIRTYTDYWDYSKVVQHYSDKSHSKLIDIKPQDNSKLNSELSESKLNKNIVTKLENSSDIGNNICNKKTKDHPHFAIAREIVNCIIKKDVAPIEGHVTKRVQLTVFGLNIQQYFGFNGIRDCCNELKLLGANMKSSLFNIEVSKIVIPVLCCDTSFICELTFDKSKRVENIYLYFE